MLFLGITIKERLKAFCDLKRSRWPCLLKRRGSNRTFVVGGSSKEVKYASIDLPRKSCRPDPAGGHNVTLTQTEVTNGKAIAGTLKGKVTVNRDCTATLTATLSVGGNPVVTATWALVYLDNQREIRGILTLLDQLPPNGSLPVQTLNAKMLFPGR